MVYTQGPSFCIWRPSPSDGGMRSWQSHHTPQDQPPQIPRKLAREAGRKHQKNQGSMESQGHRVRKVEWVSILCKIASILFFVFFGASKCNLGQIGPQVSPSMTILPPFPTPYDQTIIVRWFKNALVMFYHIRSKNDGVQESFEVYVQVPNLVFNLSKNYKNYWSYQPIQVIVCTEAY